MDRKRDIRDYEMLASVRRRRIATLQAEVGHARSEHEHCMQRHSASEAAWLASLRLRDDYAAKTGARTVAGRQVRLEDLDSARNHGLALQGSSENAAEDCRHAMTLVNAALARYGTACRNLAINQARMLALIDQAERWKQAISAELEDREDDERSDVGRVRS